MKQQLMMLLLGTASVFCSCETQVEQHEKNELRAPAYPLVTIDPYTSAWSTTDNLYDSPVKHWTGKDFSLLGVAKVDGQTYRFMGTEELELRPLVKTSEQGSWTGGLGNIIYKETDSIDYYDQDLTLKGLELIYEKNKKIARESV